jgi:hypothetical protein
VPILLPTAVRGTLWIRVLSFVMSLSMMFFAVAPLPVQATDPSPDPSASAAPNPTPSADPSTAPDPPPSAEPTTAPDPSPTPDPQPTPDASTPDPSAAPSAPAGTVPVIISFAAGTSDARQVEIIAAVGITDVSAIAQLRMRNVLLHDATFVDEVAALNAYPEVLGTEFDRTRAVDAAPNDTAYPIQWALPQIGWDQLFGSTSPSGTATVAILDTGVDASHPDLDGILVPGASMLDGSTWSTDPNGHGTWMTGIVAAETDNAYGMAGVAYAGVSVMPVVVLGADGTGQDSDIIAGVVYAADHGADVILMAFSNPGFSPALQAAIDYAWAQGAVLVAATGNDASSSATYPAGDRGVIGVAATDQTDAVATFSNYGTDAFMAAPGVDIQASAPGGGRDTISGTSASAAFVAGSAALLAAIDPSASNGTIVGRLARNADPAADPSATGNGRLNLARAASDTSTDAVEPAGAAPVGDGGPLVGPYVAASSGDITGVVKDSVTSTSISGATVTATCPACSPLAVSYTGGGTTTNATGGYSVSFSYAGNGPVTVTVTASAPGYAADTGSSASVTCSNAGTCTGSPFTRNLTLTAASGSISGVKFEDANADGSKTGDSGPAGSFNIKIYNDAGATAGSLDGTDVLVATIATTAGTGAWSKTGLSPGVYYACEESQSPTWTQSYPTALTSGSTSCAAFATLSPLGYKVTVSSGSSKTDADFGNYTAGTVSGTKFEDPNADGNLADGTVPAGATAWTIKAFTDAATPVLVSSTTTNTTTGTYSLPLQPGSYLICEEVQASWTQSYPANTNCADASGVGGGGHLVTVTSSDTFAARNFGNYQNATISGLKFHDRDGDGLRDADGPDNILGNADDEAGLPGWEIHVFGTSGLSLAVHEHATTLSDGTYSLSVPPGASYTVCETLQATWFQSTPTVGADCTTHAGTPGPRGYAELDVRSGQTRSGDNFGNYQQGTVSGTKWEDKNGDGQRDADGPDNILGNADDEAGLPGWEIFVDYNNNTALGGGEPSALTAANGSYTISGVNPGTWTLREVAQSGWTCSYPNPGVSSPKVSTNCTYSVTVTSGGSVTGKDFGNWTTGTVSGTKWEDKNGDGVRDADGPDNILGNADDEAGLIGWTIRAFNDGVDGTLSPTEGAAAPAATTTTAADGTYTLVLNPGNYVICEVVTNNWAQTKPSGTACQNATYGPSFYGPGGYAVTVTSSSSATAKDFGNVRLTSGLPGTPSTITDSAFQLKDDLSPWTITDFEILLGGKDNTIVATNPGQFYYHQRVTNTLATTVSVDFAISWPCQFVTQTGTQGNPLHSYVQYASDPANTWRDWTPQSSNPVIMNAPAAGCLKTTSGPTSGTATMTVNNVPAGAKVWVTVHLDYALKGTLAPSPTFGNPPILYTPFASTATIKVSGVPVGFSSSSTSLLGRGKKVTVIYGTVRDGSGNTLDNVWIRLTQGSNSAFAQTGADGTYVFYDGQSCTPADGLDGGCTGASSTFTFANGTSNVTLTIMGSAGCLPINPTTPCTPPSSWAYPTGTTKATVTGGTTQTFTSPTAPSYGVSPTFGVAKGSAYNRDWKFTP